MARFRSSVAVATSLVIHAAFLALVLRAEPRPRTDDAPREDPWTGNGLEVDAFREEPVAEVTRADGAEPSAPSPVAEEAPTPEPTPAEPRAPREAAPAPEAPRETPTVEPSAPRPRSAGVPKADASPNRNAPPASEQANEEPRAPVANSAPSGAGVFGAAGLPPGVRHLALAFARALPKGAHSDASFRELPLGKLGEARIRLHVDEDGKLGPLELVGERAREELPAPIVRMLENALRLLAFGRFSLSNTALEPGTLSLRVRVEISEEAPSIAENAQPNHVRELKGPASGAENPKRAWFVLNSGRRVDAWVNEE